jgi:hypothetical protein
MEVQVVLAEVRERRHGEADAVGAVQLQRVGGDLHRARLITRVEHRAERRLQVDRLRRRAHGRPLLTSDDGRDAAQQPARPPGGLEQLPYEVRGGRLAARARDPDDRELGGGIAVHPRRRARHRGADVVDQHLGHAQPQRALDHQRGRAAGDRVAGEVVPVAGEAGHAEEQRSRLDRAVVVGEGDDVNVGPVAEQFAQRHAGGTLAVGSAPIEWRRA